VRLGYPDCWVSRLFRLFWGFLISRDLSLLLLSNFNEIHLFVGLGWVSRLFWGFLISCDLSLLLLSNFNETHLFVGLGDSF